jgi:serine/threonine protein kinase
LSRGEYSGKVDVYAFGIMLLELYTQKDPFGFLKKIWGMFFICLFLYLFLFVFVNFNYILDLPDYIIGGSRPEIPADCPPEYAALMAQCWAQNPTDRSSSSPFVPLLLSSPDLFIDQLSLI